MISFWLPKIISTIFYITFVIITILLFPIVIENPTAESIAGLCCAVLFDLGWSVFVILDIKNIYYKFKK